MALALLAINDSFCATQGRDFGALMLAGALYPHLGHLLLGRLDISRRRGHLLFLVDGFFVGGVIVALGFAVVPSTVLVAINLFNWMVVGGPSLVALGVGVQLAGIVIASTELPTTLPIGCGATQWLASGILIAYLLIVGSFLHRLVDDLRQQQAELQAATDAALDDKACAERALLSVLPPSAARAMTEHGKILPASGPATLLRIDFSPAGKPADLAELADSLHICDTILCRHGFELIKTFGDKVLALSRAEDGADAALAAIHEIHAFFADHDSLAGMPCARSRPRFALDHGPVTTGLTQPERLNFDAQGSTVDELDRLAGLNVEPESVARLSAAAQRHLTRTDSLTAIPGSGSLPAHYRLTLHSGS